MRSALGLVAALIVASAITATTATAATPARSGSPFGQVRPDDRAVGPMPDVAAGSASRGFGGVRPDDRPVGPMPYVLRVRTVTPSHVARSGFGWRDAAIGAAAGAGLVLLALGASVLVRHMRAEPRTA